MPWTPDTGRDELDRMGGSRIGRPSPQRDRWGRYHRDLGAEWDWFYELDVSERRYIAEHHMVDHGDPPDVMATYAGLDIDAWAEEWLYAVRLTRAVDPEQDYYAEMTADLVGPDEIADLLVVQRNTIVQWRRRGVMPEPIMTLSSMPIWSKAEIILWARRTGRECA